MSSQEEFEARLQDLQESQPIEVLSFAGTRSTLYELKFQMP
jgi:hypothetical protein